MIREQLHYQALASALRDATPIDSTRKGPSSDYMALLTELPLIPIADRDHLAAAMAVLDRLYADEQPSGETRAYRRVLVTLVADYERRNVALPPVRGVALLRHLMEENGLRQTDLVPLFGAKSAVSEVLSGKRRLALGHIEQLGACLRNRQRYGRLGGTEGESREGPTQMSKKRGAPKKYRAYDPAAPVELAGDLRGYLPSDHAVFLLCDLVDELDLSTITGVYEQGDGRGQPPYHPVLLTKLLVYAYCEGVTSSRQIMRKTYEDIAFRVLCVDQHPDFRTISDFRERHLEAFRTIFTQTVQLAQRLGQVRLEHVAQDGSKVLANASKHKALSYERMAQTEERLGQEITALLAQAQQSDAAEDARYGAEHSGDDDPAAVAGEVRFREARRARIRAAKAALEARALAEAAAQQAVSADQKGQVQLLGTASAAAETPIPQAVSNDQRGQLQLLGILSVPGEEAPVPEGGAPQTAEEAVPPVLPAPTDQYNFTDPDSRIMPSSQGFVQAYNAQAAVDSYRQIIVACDVCQEPTDTAQLQPLFDQVRQTTGAWPDQGSADSGYWSEPNVRALTAQGIDVYLPPPRPRRGADGTRPTEQTNPAKARMEAKLATPSGRQTYSQRKETVEPVFGQMKEGRGLRRFRTRGIIKVRGEWALWCATHNLGKLARVLRGLGGLPSPVAPVLVPCVLCSALPQVLLSALGRLCRALWSPPYWCYALPPLLSQTGS